MTVDNGGGRQGKVRVDYPANSKRGKDAPVEKARPEKVVEGAVTRRKKGLRDKLAQTFLSEDSSSVFTYVVVDVLVPAAKNAISDAISQGIERMLFGDIRTRRAPVGGGRPGGYTNYSRMHEEPRREMTRQARATHDFSDIVLASRGDAEDVIDRLRDLISQYETATVADLYDLVGLTGDFTDDKWGWYDLRVASVRAVRGGYLLNLPRTQPIT
jgi:hypothetical protein